MQKLQPIKQHFNRHNPIKVEFSDFDKGTATGRLRLIAPTNMILFSQAISKLFFINLAIDDNKIRH